MPLIAIEVVLGFVVPVGWGVWELMSLRRERRRDAEAAAVSAASASRPTGPASSDLDTPPASRDTTNDRT